MDDAELLAVRMEEGPQAKESRRPLESGKGREPTPPQSLQKHHDPPDTWDPAHQD